MIKILARGIVLVGGILLLLTTLGYGQGRPIFSTYVYNGLALNPAYAGSLNIFSAIVTNRSQWVNIDGAPEFQSLTAHTTFYENQIGVGLNVNRDAVGVHEQISLFPSFAYKIRMSRWILAMGLQGGFDIRTSKYDVLNLREIDPNFPPLLRKFNPNFGTGVYLANRNFFLGASVPYILAPTVQNISEVESQAKEARHLYLTGGFVTDLTANLKLSPSVLVRKQERSPWAFDINFNLIISEIVYAGISSRFGSFENFESISVMTQLVLNENFRLGYAYDIALIRDLNDFTAGSHEILLNYRIKLKIKKKDGLCPVYF